MVHLRQCLRLRRRWPAPHVKALPTGSSLQSICRGTGSRRCARGWYKLTPRPWKHFVANLPIGRKKVDNKATVTPDHIWRR
jgi:hypothetical protein